MRPLSRKGTLQPARSLVELTSGTKEEAGAARPSCFPSRSTRPIDRDNIGKGNHSRSQTLNSRLTNSLFLRTNLNKGRSTVNPLNCPRTVFFSGSNQLLLRSSGTNMDGNMEGIDDDANDDDNRDNGTDDSSFRMRKECTN
jgi:hypothetical protein